MGRQDVISAGLCFAFNNWQGREARKIYRRRGTYVILTRLFSATIIGTRRAAMIAVKAATQGRMRTYGWLILVAMFTAVLSLLGAGCSRNTASVLMGDSGNGVPAPAASQSQAVPFRQSDDSGDGLSPSEMLVAVPRHVPTGTPIVVRLESGVSSATARAGDSFQAVLDEPIEVAGHVIAPKGARVVGRVVSAKASGYSQDPGYLRVTLATITLKGKAVSVQTSSLAVRGKAHERHDWQSLSDPARADGLVSGNADALPVPHSAASDTARIITPTKKNVGFGAERRLTFRLIGALDVKG